MNILFVTPYYPPLTYGGIESQVATLAEAMSAEHYCTIAAPAAGPDSRAREHGVTIYRTRALCPSSHNAADLHQLVEWYERVCETEQVDCILAHNLHTWVPPQVAGALHAVGHRHGVPVALRVHNFCGPAALQRIRGSPWSRILCVSNELAGDLVQHGVAPGRVTVLYPPVDISAFRPAPNELLHRRFGLSPERPVVLHASRIVGGRSTLVDKGVLSVMRAVSRVEGADLVLSFPPPAPWLRNAHERALIDIRELATRLCIERRTRLISARHPEMPKVYNGADIFTMLSELEALGCVYLEAAACALPVVGRDVGGVREGVEDALTGFVVADMEAAASVLSQLVRNRRLRHQLGLAGRDRVQRMFSASRIASQLESVIETDVEGARRGRARG